LTQDETQETGDATPEEEAPATVETPDEAPAPAEDEPAGDEPVSPAEDPEPTEEPEAGDEPKAAAAEEPAAKQAEGKAKDVAPGAELEPILLDDERELSAEERARLEAEREEQARLDAAVTEDEVPEEPLREGAKLDLPADARIQATGKRKTSVARVVIAPGGGAFKVNRRSLDEYFPRAYHQTIARQALAASGYEEQVDVSVRVHGGGISGQADAVRHGIARALVDIDPELRGELKRRGMLTRDARAKERRKAGLKKARKRPQFSKR
jgi:small subunit ribosomal protein S9